MWLAPSSTQEYIWTFVSQTLFKFVLTVKVMCQWLPVEVSLWPCDERKPGGFGAGDLFTKSLSAWLVAAF